MRAWRAAMVVASMAEVVGGFLPWVRTGERERNAYELVDAARSLDALDSALVRGLASAWYLVPLAAALCWLGLLLDPGRPAGRLTIGAGLLAVATGTLGTVFGVAVEQAPTPVMVGVRATLVMAVATAGSGAMVAIGGVAERKAARDELAPGGPRRLAASGDATP